MEVCINNRKYCQGHGQRKQDIFRKGLAEMLILSSDWKALRIKSKMDQNGKCWCLKKK